jgi:hypothetical protein
MRAIDFVNEAMGTSVPNKLEVVKVAPEQGAVVLKDDKNLYLVSIRHLEEMGEGISATKSGDKMFFSANWRKASNTSEWLRADEAQARVKITAKDLL